MNPARPAVGFPLRREEHVLRRLAFVGLIASGVAVAETGLPREGYTELRVAGLDPNRNPSVVEGQ